MTNGIRYISGGVAAHLKQFLVQVTMVAHFPAGATLAFFVFFKENISLSFSYHRSPMTLSSENKCLQDKKLKFVQHRFQSSFLLVRFLGILSSSLFFLWQDFIYLFLEGGERREREGKKHQPVASHTPLTRALACNPGMYPDQESNQ